MATRSSSRSSSTPESMDLRPLGFRLLGIPIIIGGLTAVAVAWNTGWTCPSGPGGGPCSHGYLSWWGVSLLLLGIALFVIGPVIVVTGLTARTVGRLGWSLLITGAVTSFFFSFYSAVFLAPGLVLVLLSRRKPGA